jgi:hypothetical protein
MIGAIAQIMHRTTKVKRQDVFRQNTLGVISKGTIIHMNFTQFRTNDIKEGIGQGRHTLLK